MAHHHQAQGRDGRLPFACGLVSAVNGFTFGMVSKDLLAIVDDILSAPEAPSVAA